MPTRINLCTNPALKNNATGWFGPSGWARTVSDTFTRANSTTTMGTADSGQAWAPQGGSTWGISSNKAYTTSASSVTTLVESNLIDLDVTGKITFGAGGSLPGLIFRALDDSNRLGIFLDTAANSFQLWKMDAGTNTTLTSSTQTLDPAIEYTVRVVAVGTSIIGYLNGVQVLTHTLTGGDATKYVGSGYTKVGWRGSTQSRYDDLAVTSARSLPRGTAFVGITAGNAVAPKIGVTAGNTYVFSTYVYTSVASTFLAGMDFYISGAYNSSSTPVSYTVGAGTITRVSTGPITIPVGINEGVLAVNGLDGPSEITAALYEQTSTLDDYFDGDSVGAVWDGTAGNSSSTLTTTDVPKSGSDSFTLTESATRSADPFVIDEAALSETGAVAATTSGSDSAALSELTLLVTLTYDDRRGRVRIEAHGFSGSVTRAVIYSKAGNRSTFTELRGGRVAVSGGSFSRPVDDYEFAPNVPTTYKIVGLSSPENSPDVIVQQSTVVRHDELEQTWLKFIAMPFLNRKITLTDWGPIGRASRNSRYDIVGRPEPVVVTDVHSSREVTVSLFTTDNNETLALDVALSQGAPIFLHIPTHCPLPTMYAAVGSYSYARTAIRADRAMFEITLTEVAAPPPSVTGAAVTWQILLNQHATWQEVLDAYSSWREVMD